MAPGAQIERDTSGEWGGDIFRCKVSDCPWPDNYEVHRSWCANIEGHACYGSPTHQHRPRKGLGGKKGRGLRKGVSFGPLPRIVSIICLGMHMAVDNGMPADKGARYRDEVSADFKRYTIYRRGKNGPDRTVLITTIPESEVSDNGDD